MRNIGDQVAYIKEISFDILDYYNMINPQMTHYQLVESSHTYDEVLGKEKQQVFNVSQSIGANEVDRFQVKLASSIAETRMVENNKVIPATQKEILFAKMNTYEVYPYVKWIGDECFPFHEIDINFKLENGARIEDVKDMLKHTMRIENSEYGIRTLDVDSFLIFLCIHHYREATMLLKILEGEDLTLYKYLDIHVFIKQTSIDWAKLISKAKLYDKEIEVYHTLWYTEHIYPGTIPNSVFSMFELKDYDFVDEYNVKDNSHERIKWKLDFYHRLFNVERRKEALEAAKDESEKLKKMITDLRD